MTKLNTCEIFDLASRGQDRTFEQLCKPKDNLISAGKQSVLWIL